MKWRSWVSSPGWDVVVQPAYLYVWQNRSWKTFRGTKVRASDHNFCMRLPFILAAVKKLETNSTVAIRIKQCSCATFFCSRAPCQVGVFPVKRLVGHWMFCTHGHTQNTHARTHKQTHTRTVNCSCQYQTNEGCLENDTYQNLNWPFPSQIVASVQDVKNMKLTTI